MFEYLLHSTGILIRTLIRVILIMGLIIIYYYYYYYYYYHYHHHHQQQQHYNSEAADITVFDIPPTVDSNGY
jgi:hypothetical protein